MLKKQKHRSKIAAIMTLFKAVETRRLVRTPATLYNATDGKYYYIFKTELKEYHVEDDSVVYKFYYFKQKTLLEPVVYGVMLCQTKNLYTYSARIKAKSQKKAEKRLSSLTWEK